jgi:hypothetical protein
MEKLKVYFVVMIVCWAFFNSNGDCTTLISENFNDKAYSYPLQILDGGYDSNYIDYDSANARGGTGYCLKFDHSINDGLYHGVGILSNLTTHLANGIYFRYWVKYSDAYYFGGDMGEFDNLKVFKIAGSNIAPGVPDIEFIYKDAAGGPRAMQLYWTVKNGGVGGTGTGTTPLGTQMLKGKWHKIEIYIKIPNTTLQTPSVVHVQVDDYDVYKNLSANITTPCTWYDQSKSFMATRSSQNPPSGHGLWYADDFTIVTGEGDLCNKEPVEPSSSTSGGLPPSIPEGVDIDVIQ